MFYLILCFLYARHRQTTIPYSRQRFGRPGQNVRGNGRARQRSNSIVHKTLIIIPDPDETSVPTHHNRSILMMQGLIIDEFPFDRSWPYDELLLNAMEQLPISLSMHRIHSKVPIADIETDASQDAVGSYFWGIGSILSCLQMRLL